MNNEVEYNIKNWVKNNISDNFEFRENQFEVITKIVYKCIDEEGGNVIVEAPTGSGKSLILMISAGVLADYYNTPSYILVSDLYLHKQYEDFINKNVKIKSKFGCIKGAQGNYMCTKNKKDVTKGVCRLAKVAWKKLMTPMIAGKCGYDCAQFCKYIQDRKHAMDSKVTVVTYQLYCRGISNSTDSSQYGWQPRPIIFCDECHNIPSIVQGCFTPTIKNTSFDNLLYLYKYSIDVAQEDLFHDEWTSTLQQQANNIADNDKELENLLSEKFTSLYSKSSESNVNSTEVLDIFKSIGQISHKFKNIVETIEERFKVSVDNKKYMSAPDYEAYECCEWWHNFDNMFDEYISMVENTGNEFAVFTASERTIDWLNKKKNKFIKKVEKSVSFNCAKEDALVKKYLIPQVKHAIFTSATIGDFMSFENNMGLEDVSEISVPSNFDFSKSPIYVLSRWKMSKNNKEASLPYIKKSTYELCQRYAGKKGIIQTWTYDIAKQVYEDAPENIKERMFLYNDSREKQDLLEYHKNTDMDSILVGPTLNEGIDMPGDECRFIIMLKVPYPFLGDKLVKAKADIYKGWYTNETLRVIQQAIGRGNRYKDDWCQTYILDGCFTKLYIETKEAWPIETRNRIKIFN